MRDWGFIYFMGSKDFGPIKIGFSKDPYKRLRQLQVSFPKNLLVMATFPGSVKVEKIIQKKFKDFKLNGEWFQPTPKLLAFIIEVQEALCPSDLVEWWADLNHRVFTSLAKGRPFDWDSED